MATIRGSNGVDNLTGSRENDSLSGFGADDILKGRGGNDTLNGGTGNDIMQGNRGDDVYIVDSLGDRVEELSFEGKDLVLSSVDYTLPSDVENLLLTGNANSGFGNNLNNQITGNSSHNSLRGYGGNDVLYGLGGSDFLVGHGGFDTLTGGSGGDRFAIGYQECEEYYDGGYYYYCYVDTFYYGEGHAIITDFNRTQGDLINLAFYFSDYTVDTYSNFGGSLNQDTAIYYDGDLIAVVLDRTDLTELDFYEFGYGY